MRLIDADALCEGLVSNHPVAIAAKCAPTIDAEPVIRCNMCKYYEADTGFCYYHDHGMDWDGFCSRGAKMDGENKCSDG